MSAVAAVRIWTRGAIRRPAQAVTVILALAAMSVGTVAALVAADSLDRLFVADAHAEWGDVDVEVTSGVEPLFGEGLARTLGVEVADQVVAAAPRLILPSVARDAAGRQEPGVSVLGLGPEERQLPPLQPLTGVADVADLGPDEVLVNARLATRLELAAGDRIELVIGVPETEETIPGTVRRTRTRDAEAIGRTVRVAGTVADAEVADLHRTPNVLVRRDVLQRWVDLPGQVSHLHLTAAGDHDGAAEDLVRSLEPTLRRLGMAAAPVLVDALEIAEDEGGQFRSLLLTLAAVVIAAAAVATLQLLTVLAEDRSAEVAVLRVHGVRAAGIRRLLAGEAAVHGLLGGLFGLLAAIPLAATVAGLLADHFAALSAGRGREQVLLEPVVAPATVATGIAIVVVTAVLAGRAAGRRLGAVELDELLRGPITRLPTAVLRPGRVTVVALLGSLVLGTGLTDAVAADALRYLGITLLLAAGWMRARRRAAAGPSRSRVDDRAALLALLWASGGAAALADFSQGYETGFGTLVVAGTVSVVAVTVLLTPRFRAVARAVRAYLPRGRWQVALAAAGASAEAAPGRTGRLHATFGVVLFTAAALQVLGSAQAIDVGRQAGGFDVVATSVVRVDERALAATDDVDTLVALPSVSVPEDRYGVRSDDDEPLARVRYPIRLVGFDGDLPARQRFRLAAALPGYGDAEAALDAVLRDGDKVVVDRYARPPGAAVGDDVVLDLGRGPVRYELIAVVDSFLLGSVLVSEEAFARLTPSPGPNLVLARGADDASAPELAWRLEAAGRPVGLDARTVDDVAAEVVSVNRTFTDVFALMLLVGLAVALTAVAAAILRSARTRRPELALLWALGLRRRHVVVSVAAEPAVVAATGSVVGLGAGLAILRLLFAAGFSDLAFVVDLPRLAVVVGALLAALVVTCLAAAAVSVPRHLGDGLTDVG